MRNTKLIVPPGSKKTSQQSALCGLLTGFTEATVIAPFEVVKVRLQVVNRLAQYNNTFDCFKKLLQAEGPRVFSLGLSSAMQRNGVWNCVYFGMIHTIQQRIPSLLGPTRGYFERLSFTFLVGVMAGILATTCNTPWDVVCSRVRNFPLEYKYTVQSMHGIVYNEGILALWKGFAAKVVRLGPGGGIMLVSYELCKQFLLDCCC